ncbi:hypothetical protein [Thermomonospora cellulosilytica]|uniref:Uncharacterized protein n=1 Tax=Thermomonospora cellulosilytica TaxID=1411118 RepID=A0A7W3MXJ7_9ACTN|nr:hypothetical protein [Thermomonospora cellulosilytica]MBA9003768.1 hypothetical protein [Thermomonospora cellulosilytica]
MLLEILAVLLALAVAAAVAAAVHGLFDPPTGRHSAAHLAVTVPEMVPPRWVNCTGGYR